jgi:hypothetical protein
MLIHDADLRLGEEHAALPLAIGLELGRLRARLATDLGIGLAAGGPGREAQPDRLAHRHVDAEGRPAQAGGIAAGIIAAISIAGFADAAHPDGAAVGTRGRAGGIALGQTTPRLELAADGIGHEIPGIAGRHQRIGIDLGRELVDRRGDAGARQGKSDWNRACWPGVICPPSGRTRSSRPPMALWLGVSGIPRLARSLKSAGVTTRAMASGP